MTNDVVQNTSQTYCNKPILMTNDVVQNTSQTHCNKPILLSEFFKFQYFYFQIKCIETEALSFIANSNEQDMMP